ncbi:glycosyltransferase family 4 protein [Candidatus Uhrbacteria bacterium]|nr:glycosyltransferase family 4 protein [Candidatus Uhrbacteria bacterium]
MTRVFRSGRGLFAGDRLPSSFPKDLSGAHTAAGNPAIKSCPESFWDGTDIDHRLMNRKNAGIFFATRPIAPPWNEGSKNLVYEIARRLDAFHATLLTYKNQDNFQIGPNKTFLRIYPRSDSLAISIRQKLAFLRTLIQSEAAIFHFFFTPELITSHVIRSIRKFKKGVFLQTIPTPISHRRSIEKFVFGDKVVVQSQHALRSFENRDIKNVSCIYPGIDTEKFCPGVSSADLRKKLKISDRERVVLFPGNYYLGCNRSVTQAVSRLLKEGLGVKFILACRISGPGDIKLKRSMLDDFERKNVRGDLVVLETVESMPELIALSDIVIFPPSQMVRKSDIPLVLLESLAMGKPIVITDIPPLNEIMMDDVGEKIQADNPDALYEAVKSLLKDDGSGKEKGLRGREMVLKYFSIEQNVKEYEKLYHSLLSGKRES